MPEINYGARLSIYNNFLCKRVLQKTIKHILPSTALIKFAKEAGTEVKKTSKEVIALPIYPELTNEMKNYVVKHIVEFLS